MGPSRARPASRRYPRQSRTAFVTSLNLRTRLKWRLWLRNVVASGDSLPFSRAEQLRVWMLDGRNIYLLMVRAGRVSFNQDKLNRGFLLR